MAHACVGIAKQAVTAEITVRYRLPVTTGATVRAVGSVEETNGRVLRTKGWLYDEAGQVVAEGSARFVAPKT
jgi:acyl-coenzyme A thioesterase PaaI-like protein